ncbi:dihydroorotase [Prevotella nigrescens]|uniref:dihydroorotase n=1 Tax=Prevotella nigrescens TaxID=28133 RepID=UPI000218325F|nr:dihydroorotase [Prevotella nigrescens]EGQ12190.1 dihydroorotase [Prevotella nigrescens ATCC 33563]UAK29580.1 dihydroorotase [Prevotella nigrescens]WMS21120.1 dihydroorotase [Prevotella nigrescens]SUB97028.1 Dihydroorotase [Prevotella nigrescens]
MRKLIQGGTIVNEGQMLNGAIVIEDNRIAQIVTEHIAPRGNFDEIVDASGCFVLPGVIDTHVHFREPGMENKADMESESRAAAFGGVTSFFEMPNTNPQTTTIEALNDKVERAKRSSHINYSFFFGATNNNADTIKQLDRHTVPGIKLFMGASTGNMLVDKRSALEQIFATAAAVGLPVMTHCEDSGIINDNMKRARMRYGNDPDICHHNEIRSEEACFQSSQLAVELALKHHTQLHIAHLSTARELGLLQQPHVRDFVTMEAVIAHLYFTNDDYATKGALIKCNPSVKTAHDRAELRRALADGRITTVATDHAPHLLSQKQGGCATAASGMPMVQYSLPTMLELVDSGVLTLERLVELMAHAPAKRFNISERGFLREGYRADIAIVQPNTPWTVTEADIQSKCKWSPMLGHEYRWKVVHMLCNGVHILDGKRFNADYRGEQIRFRNEKIDCL